ncbi:hypothetical protein [Kluyvera intermedia]|uniref:hypothetical protein n=1 Tax=Kluyvera intermedia TaxID=61648 RepID=UPI003526ACF2
MKFSDYELKMVNKVIKESLESRYPNQPVNNDADAWENTLNEVRNYIRHTQILAFFIVIEKYRRDRYSWWYPLTAKGAVSGLLSEKLLLPPTRAAQLPLSDAQEVFRTELIQTIRDDEYGLFHTRQESLSVRISNIRSSRPSMTEEDVRPDSIQWEDYPDQQLHNPTEWTPFPG